MNAAMNVVDDIPDAPRGVLASPLLLIGTPYARGGVSPVQGFDCFTLLAYVRWHWFGKLTPMVGDIPKRKLPPGVVCAICLRRALGRPRDEVPSPWTRCGIREGCVVALGQFHVSRLHHCGVWIQGGVLHALESCGVAWTPGGRIGELYKRVEYYECRD